MYKKAGVKAIYQGGEDHELTGLSFNAISNYDDSYGKKIAPELFHVTPQDLHVH